MAKKYRTDEIPSKNYAEDWGGSATNTTPTASDEANTLPYSGEAVQKFIKDSLQRCEKKIGYYCWSSTPDASNFYHLWGFASEEDKTSYMADPEGCTDLLLVNEALPISTVQGDSYGAYLWADVNSSTEFVVSGNTLKVRLRFAAVRTSNGDRLNMGSAGTLIVQRKTSSTDWTTLATLKDAIPSTDYADTNNYTEVDLGSYLVSGKQQLRVRATFDYTDDSGDAKTATTTYAAIGTNITCTTLDVTCQQNWQTPIYASSQQSKGYPVSYVVYGTVAKTLHIEVTGGNGNTLSLSYELTADQDSTTITKNISDSTDTYKLWKHGVRTVKAWLTCDDGQGGTISSKTLVNRFMVVNPTTDADKTTPYLMIQNLVSACDNYAQCDLCQYAVYSPGVDGSTNNGADVTTIFYLTGYAENFPDDNPTQYFRIENVVTPGTQNTLNTTVEIEAEDEDAKTISAYFRVWRNDGGTEVNFLQTSQGIMNTVINVDNSESFAPKSGADFVLNPKTRNNSESNPLRIINAKTGEEIESTWEGFGLVKDGWIASDEDGQRVLRVPAGAKVNFKYNPFAQFVKTADSSLEIEIDFKTRNVTNEDDPIVSLFEELITTDSSGNTSTTFKGLKMQPLGGEVHTKSNAVSDETNFKWREGERTHIAINIHNAVAANKGDALIPSTSTYDTTATKIALVRVFINGDIEREFKYSITDTEEFCSGEMSNGGFTIGQEGADIDIYGIRVYQNTTLEAEEVRGDYVSTLPTTAEKISERDRNDILTGGKVDMEKCRTKGYRCIVWHGVEPYKENTSAQQGWWEIFQYDNSGNYVPEYSGTICKNSAALPTKRQGSTANTYYYSNIQTKFNDVKNTIDIPLTDLHESIEYKIVDTENEDGTTTRTVSLKGGCLGKNFPVSEKAQDYPYITIDGVDGVTVPDGWIDGNGKYRGQMYQLNNDVAYFQKGVLKINYASSMQSHLPGVNNIYNDLHRAIVGKNSLQEGYDKARVSKYTEPFLFFTQALDSDTPVYRGPATWGAGKMDKPTWGYVKKLHPMFAMFEGSDNNYDLTDMRVPFTWNCPDCSENITYSVDDEGYFYNGQQCLDFDGGATDDNDIPKQVLTDRLQETWNWLYLHAPMIEYYKGTFDKFQSSDEAKRTSRKYWCTDGDDAYILKRYNFVDKKWVDAGLWDDTNKIWGKIDLRTDEMTSAAYEASENKSEYKVLNEELKGAIVAHAKKYLGWYFKEKSVQLYYALIIHLLCGTDNCSKNTYYTIDPTAVDVTIDGVTKSCYLFELHTDDVDTMLAIDNNGRTTKPYYIDRMHPYVDGDTATNKYEGANNVLFNLCELMYEDTKEMQSMVKNILTTMESFMSETDVISGFPNNGQKVSVYGCLWKYIYFIQSYFPQVAFNEAARIRYEFPEMIGFVSYGSGARGVRPITQSNGALLQCELQFIERRLVLMASYAAWGPFSDGKTGNLGISDATEGFSLQAFHTPDAEESLNTYEFTVTPHQYIYPTGIMGQTSIDPHVRVAPGESYLLSLGSTSSNDTGMSINGINYYRSIGNIGDISTTPKNTVTINGKRLIEFIAEPSKTYIDKDTGAITPAFRPGSINMTAKSLRKFSMKGCVNTSGSVDLSSESRLIEVDARQTKLTDVVLPNTFTLTTVRLPETITSVNVSGQANISTLTLEGYNNLVKYIVRSNTKINTYSHVVGMYQAQPTLKQVVIGSINWDSENQKLSVDQLMWLKELHATLAGVICMLDPTTDRFITIAEKMALVKQYGNIDSKSNALYINYSTLAINSISIYAESFMTEIGKTYKCTVITSPANGNNVAIKDGEVAIKWTIGDSAKPYAHWTDDANGLLTVDTLSDGKFNQKHTITVSVETMKGATLEATKKVGFYRHIPVVGDFAYADGTFDGDWDEARDCVGLVFMRLPLYDEDDTTLVGYDVRVVSKEPLTIRSTNGEGTWTTSCYWGVGYYNDTEGFQSEKTNIETALNVGDASIVGNLRRVSSRWNGSQVVDGVIRDSGTYNGVNYETINVTTYRDASASDGYKALNKGGASTDYDGKGNTYKIVSFANKIISDYLGKEIPNTMNQLGDGMAAMVAENSSASKPYKYVQFYYPSAYGCYLYEPTVSKGECNEVFKATHWYLPACGECCRLCNFWMNGDSADDADFGAASEADTPIFANAASKAGKALMYVPNGIMQSSTDNNAACFWGVGDMTYWGNYAKDSSASIITGFVYTQKASGGTWQCAVPCCAVTFNL